MVDKKITAYNSRFAKAAKRATAIKKVDNSTTYLIVFCHPKTL